MNTKRPLLIALTIFTFSLITSPTHAGVFTLTQFVDPSEWSLGIEPEITLSSPSGFAMNGKFTYGLNSLSNLQFGIGTGSGPREFRIGGAYTFDFIPDIQGQVGAGVALQAYLYKIKNNNTQTELTAVPYIHKSFKMSNGTSADPYLSVPFGFSFLNNTYHGIAQLVGGTFINLTPNFAYSLELGLNLSNNDSYLAGGVVYTH